MPFPKHPHTEILVDALVSRFKALASGESISYADIQTLIGMNPQREGRAIVTAAKKNALQDGVSLMVRYRVGFERTPAEGFNVLARKTKLGLHRKAKTGYNHMSAISTEELERLSPHEQNSIMLSMVMFGRISTFTNEKRFQAKLKPLGNQTLSQDVSSSMASEMFAQSRVKRDKKKLG